MRVLLENCKFFADREHRGSRGNPHLFCLMRRNANRLAQFAWTLLRIRGGEPKCRKSLLGNRIDAAFLLHFNTRKLWLERILQIIASPNANFSARRAFASATGTPGSHTR